MWGASFGDVVTENERFLAKARPARKLRQEGNFEEAARLFAEALEIRPEDVHARAYLANCLVQIGRTEEALAEAKKPWTLVRV